MEKKPWVFETCYGKIEVSRNEDGSPKEAYFHQGDLGYPVSPGGSFKDWCNTEFRINYCGKEACLFVMSPREIGRANF